MKRFGVGLLYAVVGYVVTAVAGALVVGQLSSNTHDSSLEAVMTGAFVIGPLGGLIAFVGGVIRSGRKPE